VKNSTGDYSLSQTGGPASITPLQPLVLSSPSTDHTDFGERLVGGQTDARTFTVVNRNGEAVNLVGNPKITLSGAGSGQFFVSQTNESTVAAAGGRISFQIQFLPTLAGTHRASVIIETDHPLERGSTFSITGRGQPLDPKTVIPAANVAVRQID
jgi:hypothetical protein